MIRARIFFTILFLVVLSFSAVEEVLAVNKRRPVPVLQPKPVMDTPYSEVNMTRVDPHGAKGIKPTAEQAKLINECLVCHVFQGDKLTTKANAQQSCFNCHNHSPHSGVDEHSKHNVTCTSCHTFHRGDAVELTQATGIFRKLRTQKIEAGLVERNSHTAMLKKNCNECHKQ